MKRSTLIMAGGGLLLLWLWKEGQKKKVAAQVAASSMPPLPTDTMMPGSALPAAQGILKEGDGLSFYGG